MTPALTPLAPAAFGPPLEIQLITALEDCEVTGAPSHGVIYEPAAGAVIDVLAFARILRAQAVVSEASSVGGQRINSGRS